MKRTEQVMDGKNIFPEWGTEYNVTLDQLLAEDKVTLQQILIDRGLIVLKGLGPNLSDAEYHAVGEKFGRVWTQEDYKRTPTDTTIKHRDTTPVSYFQTNNMWGARDMKYHADMAHVGENSFPARSLYMVRGAVNHSGETSWLNLEVAWAQFTREERDQFKDYYVVQQDMYKPGTNLIRYPFLKANPNSGKFSPRVNCYTTPGKNQVAWIHHIEKDTAPLDNTGAFVEAVYRLCESKINTVYSHSWDDGDMIIYDNWNSVHKRTEVKLQPGESDRLLKRLTFNI
jgi:alpha-ketoglutarate-dependent taurine dioxygenase